MPRSRKTGVPFLFAFLMMAGIVTALLGTSFSPIAGTVHGRLALWLIGAGIAVVSFFGGFISWGVLCFPEWEQKRSIVQTKLRAGNAWTPILMFPYSREISVLMTGAFLAILTIGLWPGSGGFFLLFLFAPTLRFFMDAVFGSQFFGLTPEGLAWRVMPLSSSRAEDFTTPQPVQFLPWSAISSVALAEAEIPLTPGSSTKPLPAMLLRMCISDASALPDLAPYQYIVDGEQGMELLIPVARIRPESGRARIVDGQTRAEPRVVWAATNYYLHHPEERGRIGSVSLALETPWGNAPEALDISRAVLTPSAVIWRLTMQRVGIQAYTLGGQCAGVVLGVPFLLVLMLLLPGHLYNHGALMSSIVMSYLLLAVLPISALLSAALASYVAPDGQERAYARASVMNYVIGVGVLTVLALALSAWQYFVPANQGGSTISVRMILGSFSLALDGLFLGGLAGVKLGQVAKRGNAPLLTRLVGSLARLIA